MLTRWLNTARQRLMPAPWRLDPAAVAPTGALASAYLLAAAREAVAAAETLVANSQRTAAPPAAAAEAPSPFDAAAASQFCNQLYRLERGLAHLQATAAAGSEDAKAVGPLCRCLERLRSVLADQGVDYQDITGQVWRPTRQDFEPIGNQPQVREGVVDTVIERCERPVVTLRGKLIQKSRGLVVRPPDPSPASN